MNLIKIRKKVLRLESKSDWLIENWHIAVFDICGHWCLVANLLNWTTIVVVKLFPFWLVALTGTTNLLSTQRELFANRELVITLKTPLESTVNKSDMVSSIVKVPSKFKSF
jgi:hypothetical protein